MGLGLRWKKKYFDLKIINWPTLRYFIRLKSFNFKMWLKSENLFKFIFFCSTIPVRAQIRNRSPVKMSAMLSDNVVALNWIGKALLTCLLLADSGQFNHITQFVKMENCIENLYCTSLFHPLCSHLGVSWKRQTPSTEHKKAMNPSALWHTFSCLYSTEVSTGAQTLSRSWCKSLLANTDGLLGHLT